MIEDAEEDSELSAALKFSDDLTDFARQYYATDFSNPARIDCPHPETLAAILRAGRLPGESLRAHLFGCSACFVEYREALAQRKTQGLSAPVSSQWRKLVGAVRARPIPAVSGAAAVVLVIVGAAYIWQKGRGASS